MTPPSFHKRTTFQKRRADVHDIPDALNRVVGALIISAEHRPRDALSRDNLAEFIECAKRQPQPQLRPEPMSNQSFKGCHRSHHPQSECLTAGEYQVGEKLSINRTTIRTNEVRACSIESLYTVISLKRSI
jgi:hypothetical protein